MKKPKPKKKARIWGKAAGFRSGLEREVAIDMDKRGIKYQYEPERIPYMRTLRGCYCGSCASKDVKRKSFYTPDFKLANGTFVETKGRLTASNRQRLSDFRGEKPTCVVRILFAANNWTTKVKRQRYSDWAEAHGYEWAIGKSIPDSWAK